MSIKSFEERVKHWIGNWKRPEFKDFRNDLFDEIKDIKNFAIHGEHKGLVSLPRNLDLRALQSEVGNQGNTSSCTGNAIASAIEFLELSELKAKVPLSEGNEEFDSNFEHISRLFIYYNERILEQDTNSDNGSTIFSGMKTLQKYGFCRESLWKFDPSKLSTKPDEACYQEAIKHNKVAYYQINSTEEKLQCLAQGYPFLFGFQCYESLMSDETMETGNIPLPKPNESCIGGHAILCTGYDQDKQVFYLKNSWGTGIGLNQSGYFTISFEYINNPNLADEFYTIRRKV